MKIFIKKLTKYIFNKMLVGVGFKSVILFDHFSRDNIYIQSALYLDTNQIDGDYVHFGVGSGLDFIACYKCFKQCKRFNRHFYLFDSFQGLPEPKETLDGKYRAGKYTFTKENLLFAFNKEKVLESDYTIIEGYFNRALTSNLRKQLSLKKVAMIILDCDLYESTADALKFVKPYLQQGTIILAGEYFNYRGDVKKGMAGAISCCFNENELVKWRPYGVSGMAFIYQSKGA